MLFDVKDHEHLVLLMQENLKFAPCWLEDMWNTGALSADGQEQRYDPDSPRDQKMDAQVPMPFRGDGRSDTPPFAWTFLRREVYSGLYGEYVPGAVRSCGYVYWDAARFKSMGGVELLEREMKDWRDPRDDDEDGDSTPYAWARMVLNCQ
jgi:hypothetical protein